MRVAVNRTDYDQTPACDSRLHGSTLRRSKATCAPGIEGGFFKSAF